MIPVGDDGTVELLVTYMEMTAPPAGQPLAPRDPSATIAPERLGLDAYRALYRTVGEAVQWDERLRLDDAALAAILGSPEVTVLVLRLDGTAAGFCEIDGRAGEEIEITYFGLAPVAQGRGLGPVLLDRALRAAWQRRPRRVWLHTDTNDHPRAQATYERAGFRAYLRRRERFPA